MKVINVDYKKARKEHKCNYCNGTILKGRLYASQFCKYDGVVYTWKSHLSCDYLASELGLFDYANDGEGVTQEHFMEMVQDNYHVIMSIYHKDVYESEDYRIPEFPVMLEFLKKHYDPRINDTKQESKGMD